MKEERETKDEKVGHREVERGRRRREKRERMKDEKDKGQVHLTDGQR